MSRIKALGQHFLTSPAVLRKIVETISPEKDELVIEIGAGKGALTFPLAERAGKVIAVEKDKGLIPCLREGGKPNVVVLEEDILRIDLRRLVAAEPNFRRRVKLAGNLPYAISSPLLFKVLDNHDLFSCCVFLLQKEVAMRLGAKPRSKDYAPLSIHFQRYYHVRLCFTVAPGSFSPPPRVQSTLVSLILRSKPLFPVTDENRFRRFLRASFAQRRKTLLNNLKSAGYPLAPLRESLRFRSLKENVRAEELSIDQFVDLFERLIQS